MTKTPKSSFSLLRFSLLHAAWCTLWPLLALTTGCPGDSIDTGVDYVLDLKCGSAEVEQGDVIDLRAILTARAQVASCGDADFAWVVANPSAARSEDQNTEYDSSDKSTCVSTITVAGLEPGKTKITLTAREGGQSPKSCTITVNPGSGKLDGASNHDGGHDTGAQDTTSGPACAAPASAEVYQPAGGHVCEHNNILQEDQAEAGLGYILGDTVAAIDSEEVIACIRVDFGELKQAKTAQVVIRAANEACGAECTGPACGTGHSATLLSSADGSAYKYVQKLFISENRERYVTEPLADPLRYLLVCRSGVGSARDHLKVDYAELCF